MGLSAVFFTVSSLVARFLNASMSPAAKRISPGSTGLASSALMVAANEPPFFGDAFDAARLLVFGMSFSSTITGQLDKEARVLSDRIVNRNQFCTVRECAFHHNFMNHLRDPRHDILMGKQRCPIGHQFGDRLAVAYAFEHSGSQVGHGFWM